MVTNALNAEIGWETFERKLAGTLILPDSREYEKARHVWNGDIDRWPAAIVRCTSNSDVVEALAWAQQYQLPITVRGGGHDVRGRAVLDAGLVIDCSAMRKVEVDTTRRIATVQAGVTVGELVDAVQSHGFIAATGTMSLVGMAGLTLGGGYGPLIGRYGLVSDNLVGARLVTADGTLLDVNEPSHPELLWGLRGGGGNFGVVVEFDYAIHPAPGLLSGLLFYSLDQAPEVLRRYRRLQETATDDLTIEFAFITAPDGQPTFLLSPTYCGDLSIGRHTLDELKEQTAPLAGEISETTYGALVRSVDPFGPAGRKYHIRSQSLLHLNDESIALLLKHARSMTSPYSMIAAHHFHGRASKIESSESAFRLRKNHLMIEICAAWESDESAELHKKWADTCSSELGTVADSGGYINFLDESEDHRVKAAIGANLPRLLALKKTFDPTNLFRSTMGYVSSETANVSNR